MSDVESSLRQEGMPAVPTGLTAWVEIDGTEYAVLRVSTRYARLETKAIADLATGTRSAMSNRQGQEPARQAIPASFEFIRGTPAKLWVEVSETVPCPLAPADTPVLLKEGKHCLMDGVIDDGGPADLSDGSFNVRCVIVSRLVYLATGATHFTMVRGSGVDTTQLLGLTNDRFVTAISSDTIDQDFWGAMVRSFESILTSRAIDDPQGRLARFLDFVSANLSDLPETALRALRLIGGELKARFAGTTWSEVVAAYIQSQLHLDIARQSLLAKIQALAEDFFFALVEHGSGIGVVPWSPIVHRSDCRKIWPSGVLSAQWVSHSTDLVAGVMFLHTHGPLTRSSAPTQNEDFILGGFRRHGVEGGVNDIDVAGDALGLFTPLPAPAWMHNRVRDGGFNFTPSSIPDLRRFTNPYAREIALRENYRGRGVTLRCPLRLDVGPCTPIQFIYPGLAGTELDDSVALFGSVEAVTVTISSSDRSAVTEMEVLYVRSNHQQRVDVDQRPADGFGGPRDSWTDSAGFHPVWAQPYRGRRLDEAPVTRSGADIPAVQEPPRPESSG